MSRDTWFAVTRQDQWGAVPHWREAESLEQAERYLNTSSARYKIAFRIPDRFLDPPVGAVKKRRKWGGLDG